FADRTEFDIDADFTAVVGPNGCGKSNIVDAILWGLGETKASHLRAKTSQDVIFAGSNRRRKLGFAEVTLVFDNEDGSLPIDTPEVAVTRRLTRGGDSDYRINGRACRLRDVADLLADSGMGRAGYAIVGQSEIDQALAASPEQRRDWIDEAAGVMRYRARRVEALRRLESADEHLARVHDILKEIESQRKPLEREAEAARKYKQVRASLREMESGLLIKEVADAVAKLDELDEKLRNAAKIAEEETARAEQFEKEARGATDQVAELEEKIEALRHAHREAQAGFEHASAALQVAVGKLESLDVLEGTLVDEAEAGHERVTLAEKDLAQAREDEEKELSALEALRTEISGADDEARRLTHELRIAEAELHEARERQSHNQRLAMEQAHREERVEAIKEELEGIDDAVPDLVSAIEDAEKNFESLDTTVQEAREASRRAESELSVLRKEEEEHAMEVRKLLSQIAVLDGRRKGIQSTIEAHEGLAQGARAVIQAVAEGSLKGSYVPVGEAVEVDSEYAVAIDTALGSSTNDLIVKDEASAKSAINYLKENRLGRATFQPLTLVSAAQRSTELTRLLGESGVVGVASDIVRCDPENRPVVDSLLNRVVLVEDLDTGLRLARSAGWKRLVTLDGEVIHAFGGVTGGRAPGNPTGIVRRKAELGEVEDAIAEAQSHVQRAEEFSAEYASKREELTNVLEAARETLASITNEHEETKGWLVNLRHELQATERAKEKLAHERDTLLKTEPAEKLEVDEQAAEERRDALLKRLAAKSSDAEKAGLRQEEAEERAHHATARRIEAERRYQSLTESEETRAHRSENLGPERERYSRQVETATKEKEANAARVQALQADLDVLTEAKRGHIETNIALSDQAKESQKTARAMSEVAHNAEIQRTRIDTRRTASVQRLLEEYGVTQEEAVTAAPTTEVPEDAAKLVPVMRRELKEMGDVNLGAIEAFERLTERFDELNLQSEDITNGKAEILQSMEELDRLTRERFETTFAQLQVAFAEMFSKMFGGGQGSIDLLDTKNVLDSGVEINVTVPGKKKQRLELLSGGERALSATAFLFALLKVKPSPLVILDEVDAPLDGRNVERFISVVREFCEHSQFIVITHNPVTMEEADSWFGVTMQEPGVSTLVPVRVPSKGMVTHVVQELATNGEHRELTGAYAKG
ncbi:MAG TPA: chromosome segregation protein SMC, partial [Fimbriimonadaceae bacterium]|nr:chromosome segregation protein SMC [Fimbriimonadaceae bacterium]